MKIILASSSLNRREILTIAQIPFEIKVSDINEKAVTETDFSKRVLEIARRKADKVASEVDNNSVIIAGDSFTVCDNKIIEKPQNKEEGICMLKFLSGKMSVFYTGSVMINTKTGKRHEEVLITNFWFRSLSEDEINEYVNKIDVTKYAGAFTPMNSPAISFISKIEGSLTSFTHSIPMDIVVPKLKEWGAI